VGITSQVGRFVKIFVDLPILILYPSLMSDEIRQAVLETIESALDAQLRAVRKLRRGEPAETKERTPRPRRSQMSIVEDILAEAGQPLHVSAIIERAKSRFSQSLDRESLVSALTKRVKRKDRFVRSAPNTFGLRPTKPVKEGRAVT